VAGPGQHRRRRAAPQREQAASIRVVSASRRAQAVIRSRGGAA
jgi:hypothetical protein